MRAGLILLYAGLASAIGTAVLLLALLISAFSWNEQLLERVTFGMTGLAILACFLSIVGAIWMLIYWIKGLAMLSRAGLMKPMYIDIGVFAGCIAIFVLTGGAGMFLLPMVWYLVHASFLRKLPEDKQDTDRQDIYSLGEVK